MQCPKCNFREMTYGTKPSGSSGITNNDGQNKSFVTGFTCILCGKWIEPEFEPVFKFNPKNTCRQTRESRENLSITQGIKKLSECDKVLWKYRKQVRELLKAEDSFNAIKEFVEEKNSRIPNKDSWIKGSIKRFQNGRLEVLMEAKHDI